ncbi:MAG: putative Ig domain-containing protein, partial [Myxococcota bacterium]
VDYKVWLSSDVLWSATDYLVHQGSMTLTGGQTVDTDVSYNLPGSVPTGNYYFLLQLDDGPSAGAIFEAAEGNNVVASPTTFNARQADLSVDPVLVLDPTPPHGPAEAAFFGENVRLDVTVANVGGATATNFEVAFYLSENETLNAFNDPFIGDVRNLTLGPGATMVVSLTAPVPSTTAGGASLVPGDFSFFAAATAVGLSETSTFNNINRSSPTKVRGPAPDLIATALAGPSRVGAGELMVVSRTVRNSGNRDAGPAAYRYFLSANSIITLDDVPLHVVTAAGESTGGTVTLGVGEQDSATDVVRVPSGTPFATYYLGVLVDPAEPGGSGAVLEISEANNALASQTVEVVAQALRVTNPSLPDAVLGLPYDYRLAAAGGDGTYSFALKPNAGDLPAGLTLDASGLLHGTPSASTTAVFSVVVTSGQKSVEARLVLRVVPLTASLTITTRQLPPAVRLVAYEHFLSAQGGIGPYTWSLESGRLPTGLVLSESGALSGVPSDVIGTTADFSLRVRDRAGNSEVRAYTLAVVDASSFLIKTLVLPPGNVGSEYLIDVAAQNADSSPVSQPIEWAVVGGGLPQGLLLEPTDEVLLIRGVPTRAGNFPFTLQVSDGKGRSDVADFVLVVYSNSAQVTGTVPEQLYRGQEVSAALSLAGAQASFGLYSGRLPLGLSLSSEGVVGGTVAEEAQLGVYNFTVLATSVDGSRALAPFTTEVVGGAPPKGGCGCTGGPPELASLWALAALALALRRRR